MRCCGGSKKCRGRGNSGRGGRGRGSGSAKVLGVTVAPASVTYADPSTTAALQSYVNLFLCSELAASTGVHTSMMVLAAVAGPATLVPIEAGSRVGATLNIVAGTQVSLASILCKALAKEDLAK